MTKHSTRYSGTANTAQANLFPQTLETIDDLVTAPVGTMIEDSDGDTWERTTHGTWRGDAVPYRLLDEAMAVYLPAEVLNHAELAGQELSGYRLGDLVKVVANDYAMTVSAGTNGVVERIVGDALYVRFRGGVVCPLHCDEIKPVARSGVQRSDRVVVTEDIFPHAPLGKGASGYVIGRVPGCIEPTWAVRIEGDSPWFCAAIGWQFPESAIAVIDRPM